MNEVVMPFDVVAINVNSYDAVIDANCKLNILHEFPFIIENTSFYIEVTHIVCGFDIELMHVVGEYDE